MKKFNWLFTGVVALSLVLQGCLDNGETDTEKQIKQDDKAIQEYLQENNVTATKAPSGVYYEVLEENEGGTQIVEDHVVGILYTIRLLPSEMLVETYADTLNPLRFSYSLNSMLPDAINYDIHRMKTGEKYRFYVPSSQAFWSYGSTSLFAPYSNFIIDVELVSLETEDQIYDEEIDSIESYIAAAEIDPVEYPNGLYYLETEAGTGATPTSSSAVTFHFTRMYLDSTVIETTKSGEPVQVYLSDPGRLVKGLKEGIELMKEGGKASLIMPSEMAFGKSIQVIPQKLRKMWVEDGEIEPETLPYKSVIYEVELLEVN